MQDAQEFAIRCKKCQNHGLLIHQPSEFCNSVISPWPFLKWGLDIIGKLPVEKGGKCFVLGATDFFTNWVKAEAFSSITANDVINFFWKHLISRFGMPKFLVMDNAIQFNNAKVESFIEMYRIKINFSPIYHPQANGMANATNKGIVANMRKNLEEKN